VQYKEKTKDQLVNELVGMRQRIAELAKSETERKCAEEAIRKSEAKYRMLIDTLPNIVFKGYKDGSVDFIDDKIKSLTGYKREDFNSRKMKWTDIVFEEDIETMKKAFIQALKTNRYYVREYRIRIKAGDILWVQEGSRILCNEEGEIEFISGAFLDITERKHAEEAVRESEAKYRMLIDNLPNIVFKGYKDGSVDFIDDKIESLTGYKREDFHSRKMKWTDIVVKQDLEKMKKAFIQALKTNRSYVREYRIRINTGDILWVQEGSQIVCDEEGEVEFISGAFLDITERKKTDVALRESESKYRMLIDNLPNIVFKGYKDGSVDFIDDKIESLTGYKREDFNSRKMKLTDLVVEEDIEKMKRAFIQALKTNRSYVRELSIRIKTGELLWLQEGSQIVCNEEGEIEFISGAFLNITERKRAEEALQKAHDELRRLSGSIMASQEKERTAIARELHDELGQVLTALRMDSMWLASWLDKRDPKAAERALKMCDLILKTIADVKGMALRLRPKVLDDLGLIAALDWHTDDFEKRTGIPCIFEHPDVVDLDDIAATAAYRITQEALTNVIRHSFATHVEVALQSEEGMLMLAVVDNGRGFNMMKLSEFEGLGLVGMRERASLAGGTLEIQSQRAKGTQVYLRLPFDGKRGAV